MYRHPKIDDFAKGEPLSEPGLESYEIRNPASDTVRKTLVEELERRGEVSFNEALEQEMHYGNHSQLIEAVKRLSAKGVDLVPHLSAIAHETGNLCSDRSILMADFLTTEESRQAGVYCERLDLPCKENSLIELRYTTTFRPSSSEDLFYRMAMVKSVTADGKAVLYPLILISAKADEFLDRYCKDSGEAKQLLSSMFERQAHDFLGHNSMVYFGSNNGRRETRRASDKLLEMLNAAEPLPQNGDELLPYNYEVVLATIQSQAWKEHARTHPAAEERVLKELERFSQIIEDTCRSAIKGGLNDQAVQSYRVYFYRIYLDWMHNCVPQDHPSLSEFFEERPELRRHQGSVQAALHGNRTYLVGGRELDALQVLELYVELTKAS